MAASVIVICVDGLGMAYLEAVRTPSLDALKRSGLFSVVRAMVPTVTNVNNVSLITGLYPSDHGIVSNYWLDRERGQEHYMESGEFVLSPTLFQRLKKSGGRSAVLTAKDKLRTLLSDGASCSLSAERPPEWAVQAVGSPPDIYTIEVNFWVLDLAIHLAKAVNSLDLLYVSTTDYPMHTYPPDHPKAQAYIKGLDMRIGQLLEAAPDAQLYITADHGMSAKTIGLDLEKSLARAGIACQAIPIIKDRYVVHHQNLGGAAYIYLHDPVALDKALALLRRREHIEEALPREEAAAKYKLHAQRIGDIFVLADAKTVFGSFETEEAPVRVRSHGSLHEVQVPFIAYNAPAGLAVAENRQIGELLMAHFNGC